jgi:hypothetical protein
MRRHTAGFLFSFMVTWFTAAAAQPAARPGACRTAAQADTTWPETSFLGFHFSLRLPLELRRVPEQELRRVAERTHALETTGEGVAVELVAAWRAPARAQGEIQEVLLFTLRTAFVPDGRPCAFAIAGRPGLVFRQTLSGAGSGANEYWTEAFWPGFALAIRGRTLDSYEIGFVVLRSLAALP